MGNDEGSSPRTYDTYPLEASFRIVAHPFLKEPSFKNILSLFNNFSFIIH